MKAYFEKRILIEKNWWGNKYRSEFLEVDVLGKTSAWFEKKRTDWYLIKLPNGETKETTRKHLYFSIQSNENNND